MADLVLIEPGQPFLALEGLLHPPSGTCDLDQGGQGCRRGAVAAVVGEHAGGAVAADQQLVVARCRFGKVDDGPVVEPLPFAPRPAESFCQTRLGTFFTRASARNVPAPVGTSAEQATART